VRWWGFVGGEGMVVVVVRRLSAWLAVSFEFAHGPGAEMV
jgi:hypothetical protein